MRSKIQGSAILGGLKSIFKNNNKAGTYIKIRHYLQLGDGEKR